MEKLVKLASIAKSRYVLIADEINLSYIAGKELGSGIALLLDRNADRCWVLQPLDYGEKGFEHCDVLLYSIKPIQSSKTYIVAKDFVGAVYSLVKALVPVSERIDLPLSYLRADLVLELEKLWNINDITREILMLRASKSDDELEHVMRAASIANEIVEEIRSRGIEGGVNDVLRHVFDALIHRIEYVSSRDTVVERVEQGIVLRLVTKSSIYKAIIVDTIPSTSSLKRYVEELREGVKQVIRTIRLGSPCSAFIDRIENALRVKGFDVEVNICGIGVETCEYPTVSDALYRDCVVGYGYAMYIEVLDRKTNAKIGFTAIYRGQSPELYG